MTSRTTAALPGLRLAALRGWLRPATDRGQRPRLIVDTAVLRATEPGLRACIPAGKPIALERVANGCAYLRISLPLMGAVAKVQLFVSPDGLLGLDLVGVEAGGLFGVPASLAAAAVREFLPPQPWLLQRPGTRWDVDLVAMAAQHGVELAPLQSVIADHGVLELRFGEP